MKSVKERRIHPRLDHKLPFNVALNGYDLSLAAAEEITDLVA